MKRKMIKKALLALSVLAALGCMFSGFGSVKFGTSEPYRWENCIMVQVD